MRLCFSILLALFIPFLSFCQNLRDNVKYYSDHPKLEWSDFISRPISDTLKTKINLGEISALNTPKYEASINTRIDLKWDYNTNNYTPNFSFKVYTLFYPATSWVIENKKQDLLLQYLQGCYDITEIHSRKLRKVLAAYKVGRNIRKQMNNYYRSVEKERLLMQQDYDIQTNFSKNKSQQEIWNKKIDSLLISLEKYR